MLRHCAPANSLYSSPFRSEFATRSLDAIALRCDVTLRSNVRIMATRNTFVVPKLSDFGAWAARIRRAVAAAKSKEAKHETLRPEESSYGVLRIECYRYLRKLKRNDLTEQLRAYVAYSRSRTLASPSWSGRRLGFEAARTKPQAVAYAPLAAPVSSLS